MQREVAVIGAGQTCFTRNYKGSVREMAFEAYREAVESAGISSGEIGCVVVSSAPEYDKQRSPAGVITEYLGLNPCPAFTVENICSSGTTGLRIGYSLISSGLHEVVLVMGFQKMSEISSAESQERMGRGADIMWESPFGTMMPAYYAMHAQAHFDRYGTTEKDLARIRVKSSKYGKLNEKAFFRKELDLESIIAAETISSPLKKYDCCANADGASCLILAGAGRARQLSARPVWVLGLGSATAPINLTGRDGLTGFDCARRAARQAYEMAGVGPEDIDVAEVHDCFTIAELMACEDLGFAPPGEGAGLIALKETYIDGKIPVNVDGGLLSKGHPIGATGCSQVRTVFMQLRGIAGPMQVPDCKVGLVHNIGGVGIYGNVIILGV